MSGWATAHTVRLAGELVHRDQRILVRSVPRGQPQYLGPRHHGFLTIGQKFVRLCGQALLLLQRARGVSEHGAQMKGPHAERRSGGVQLCPARMPPRGRQRPAHRPQWLSLQQPRNRWRGFGGSQPLHRARRRVDGTSARARGSQWVRPRCPLLLTCARHGTLRCVPACAHVRCGPGRRATAAPGP